MKLFIKILEIYGITFNNKKLWLIAINLKREKS